MERAIEEQAIEEPIELSDEDLENVAGGLRIAYNGYGVEFDWGIHVFTPTWHIV